MARLAGAKTSPKKIISGKVGFVDGGITGGFDVLRVKQLLRLNGYRNVPMSFAWDRVAEAALMDFQRRHRRAQRPALQIKPYVDPIGFGTDMTLYFLAWYAGVLLNLPQTKGASAFTQLHRHIQQRSRRSRKVWKASAAYTLARPHHNVAITYSYITNTRSKYYGTKYFDITSPIVFSCITYANLMMAAWSAPYAGGARFRPDCTGKSARNSLAKTRYKYKHRGWFKRRQDVEAVLRRDARRRRGWPGSLYALARISGHCLLLYNGRIYECSASKNKVMDTELKQWWRTWVGPRTQGFYLRGPAP